MKQTFVIGAALLAGFVGGAIGTRVVPFRQQPSPAQVIRARRFELVDEAGQTISYWGIDKLQDAVLVFGSHWPIPPTGGSARPGRSPSGLSDLENQRVAIGVIDDSPFVTLRGADGKTRVRLLLSMYGKPVLLMEDETGPRVLLGVEQSDTPGPGDNDWSLAFGPERARIGMYTEKHGGQTYVRGSFAVHKDKVKYPYGQPK